MIFKKLRRSSRIGISIAEMCVVLAVVSIAALMVVSFTTLVSAHTQASAVKLNAMEDMELTEVIVEDWVEKMLDQDAASIDAGEGKLTARIGGRDYSIYLEESALVAQLPGESDRTFPLKTMKALRFDTIPKTDSAIYFCTMVYEVPSHTSEGVERTYTFCVQPRTGESLN